MIERTILGQTFLRIRPPGLTLGADAGFEVGKETLDSGANAEQCGYVCPKQ